MENTKITLVISVVLIIAAAIGGYYYGSGVGYDKGIEIEKAVTTTTTTVEEVVVNPLEDLPSTNPFEEIVNPFEEAYTNPFE